MWKKTVTHKLRVGQYLLLFYISYYLKISLICSKFLIQIRTLLRQKMQNTKNLKIKFQQTRVKPKCSIDKETKFQQRRVKTKCSIDKKTNILPILYQFHLKNLNVGMYFYLSATISRKKLALVNLFLITYLDVSILLW